ncbi:SBF-like CPA transporter family-domain-containing protein [Dipodascopsis tothii]|uniref:SBF-like CPA transporter family-domain-containing protein n=1 Tax=Dipodascopsis tothii TaxID=44089 RepID=UPI0034CD412B
MAGPGRDALVRRARWTLQFALDQWFLIALGIAILVAYLVPNLMRSGGWVAAQYTVIYGCPAMIFLIAGLTIDTQTLVRTAALYRVHAVCQIMSYFYTSAIIFALTEAALLSGNTHLNVPVLAGFILLGCGPTTIGSNVVFTRQAHGNHAATLIEVTISNVVAPVLTPALVSMYMSASSAHWGALMPGSGAGYGQLYKDVFKQLGLTVFVPLFVGQVTRILFTKQVAKVAAALKINKFSSVFLIFIMMSTFSTSFYTGAFSASTGVTKVLVIFQNIGVYFLFLFSSLFVSRAAWYVRPRNRVLDRILGFFRFNKADTIAICYVVPPKTPALGVPLINAMYASNAAVDVRTRQMMQIPLILYQIEQLVISQFSIPVFRRWVRDEEEAAALAAAEKAAEAGDGADADSEDGDGADGRPRGGDTAGDHADDTLVAEESAEKTAKRAET